jgi:hypothetical protein
MADAAADQSPGRHEQAVELRKEAYRMALYVVICLLAAFAALPETDAHAHVMAIVWGITLGLAVAHWFAFRVSARMVGAGSIRPHDLESAGAQLAGAAGVARREPGRCSTGLPCWSSQSPSRSSRTAWPATDTCPEPAGLLDRQTPRLVPRRIHVLLVGRTVTLQTVPGRVRRSRRPGARHGHTRSGWRRSRRSRRRRCRRRPSRRGRPRSRPGHPSGHASSHTAGLRCDSRPRRSGWP